MLQWGWAVGYQALPGGLETAADRKKTVFVLWFLWFLWHLGRLWRHVWPKYPRTEKVCYRQLFSTCFMTSWPYVLILTDSPVWIDPQIFSAIFQLLVISNKIFRIFSFHLHICFRDVQTFESQYPSHGTTSFGHSWLVKSPSLWNPLHSKKSPHFLDG